MYFICKMNAVRYIVLASVSIMTVKTIKRIPIHPFYRAHSDEKQISEDISQADNKDMITLNQSDANNRMNSSKIGSGRMKFTDFILEVAKVLKTYDDNLLHEVFVEVDYVVWEHMYKGCKSQELTEIRRYVSDQIGLIKDLPAYELRQHLDNVIDVIINEDYGNIANLVSFVNSLYVWEHGKFLEVLLALVHRRISADVDLAAILKRALETLVFDHYCHLDQVLRRELIKMIEQYWAQFASQRLINNSLNTLTSVTPFTYDKSNETDNRKRRFDTVNERIVQERRNNDFYSEYSDENSSSTVVTNASAESSHTSQKPSTSPKANDSLKINVKSEELQSSVEDSVNSDDLLSKNNTTDENSGHDVMKTIAVDQQSPGVVFKTDEAKRSYLEDSNNTIPIHKLVSIGTLAKEIDDLVSPEDQVLRRGPNILNWNALLDMDFLGTMDGGIPIAYNIPPTMQDIQNNEVGGKKDVIISMKAKYKD